MGFHGVSWGFIRGFGSLWNVLLERSSFACKNTVNVKSLMSAWRYRITMFENNQKRMCSRAILTLTRGQNFVPDFWNWKRHFSEIAILGLFYAVDGMAVVGACGSKFMANVLSWVMVHCGSLTNGVQCVLTSVERIVRSPYWLFRWEIQLGLKKHTVTVHSINL